MSKSVLLKTYKIQMYANEEPVEWAGFDVLNALDFYTSLIKKEQQVRIEIGNLLVQEQNKTKQLENDKTKLTTDLTNLNKDVNTLLTK